MSAWPEDTTPLEEAVVKALTTETGLFRALKSADLFSLSAPGAEVLNPASLKARPSCWVITRDFTSEPPTSEVSDEVRVRCTVQVTLHYWAGSDVMKKEALKARARIARDMIRVRAALAYPGALLDVGLDGNSLRAGPGEWRTVGPEPLRLPEDGTRILRVNHLFLATLTLSQPT